MFRNSNYFQPPLLRHTYLRARGFRADGNRSGGLALPKLVDLAVGTRLLRLFNEADRKFGEWWFTAHEMKLVVDHFARSGSGFAEGRKDGKGILHAVLAVRHEWDKNNPAQLGRFFTVKLRDPLKAYYGEADDAPSSGHVQTQRAARIVVDGAKQQLVRQIFIPVTKEYPGAFVDMGTHDTDTSLLGAVSKYRTCPMYFE